VVLTIGAALVRRRLPGGPAIAILACAVGGLALVSWPTGGGGGPRPLLGVLAALACGLVYAAATAVNQRLASADPLTLTGLTSAVGALALLPVVLPGGVTFAPTSWTIGALLYLGVVTTAGGYGLFFAGLRSTPAEVAAVLTLLEPLAATALGVGLLGERLSAADTAGAALLLLAVAGLYLRPARRRVPGYGRVSARPSSNAAGASSGVPAICARQASAGSRDRSASQ
jgi:DME family drug/metabolite transporter